jgi:flagella basal body P-ring formation protein FlgA
MKNISHMRLVLTCIFLGMTVLPVAHAQLPVTTIELSQITQEAEKFLQQQTLNLNHQIEISIKPIDSRLKLQACEQLTSFLPPGAKAWGKVTVGIRCNSPKPWTIYVAAQVRVFGDYFVTKNAISSGQIITEQDIVKVHGELSSQAPGVVMQTQAAVGKTMLASVPAGVSVRLDMFKSLPVIQQGQNIKVISQGVGFRVSNDAIAVNSANEGQIARAKTTAGLLISGIARTGGIIEVQ